MRSVLDLGRGTPRKQFGCFHELVFVRDVLEQCLCLERDSGKTSAQVFPREPRSWNWGSTVPPQAISQWFKAQLGKGFILYVVQGNWR